MVFMSPQGKLREGLLGNRCSNRFYSAQIGNIVVGEEGDNLLLPVAAEREGVSIATLRRAKFDLGVRSIKDGVKGVWYWSFLPP